MNESKSPRQKARQEAKELTWSTQVERLEQAMAAAGTNPTRLAKDAGQTITYFRDFVLGRKKSIDAAVYARAAEILRADLAWLSASDSGRAPERRPEPEPSNQMLPLLGLATGGADGRLIFSGEALDELARPPQLMKVKNAYAVAISGESMEPRYRPGEIVYVNPSRPARRGDDVVVQVMQSGELSGFVKEFISRDDNKLVVRQFNPKKTLTFRANDVQDVHVIEFATR
jgi:phage repressor protein C with HTH and peptisase S24 domain